MFGEAQASPESLMSERFVQRILTTSMSLLSNAFKSNQTVPEASLFIVQLMSTEMVEKRDERSGNRPQQAKVLAMPESISDEEVKAKIAPVAKGKDLLPMNSISTSHFLLPFGGKGIFVTNLPTFTMLTADRQAFQALADIPPQFCSNATQKSIRKMLQASNRFIASKGTLPSWIDRWVHGFNIEVGRPYYEIYSTPTKTMKPYELLSYQAKEFVRDLIAEKILVFNETPDLLTTSDPYDVPGVSIYIAWESHAGPAYGSRLKKDPDVVAAVNDVILFLTKHLKNIGLVKTSYYKTDLHFDTVTAFYRWLLIKRPLWVTSMLTPKLQVYERVDLETAEVLKTRPYYRGNFHWVKLFAPIIAAYKQKLALFYQGGSNAVGHSWVHGGATKLLRWVLATPLNDLRVCSYADDQLWVFNLDGKLFVMGPDAIQMDFNVTRDRGYVFMEIFDQMFPKASVFWRNSAQLMCILAFSHPVIVYKAMTYYKKDRLSTGASGTTEFDGLVSMEIALDLRTRFSSWISEKKRDFTELQSFVTKFCQSTIVKFKPETLSLIKIPNFTNRRTVYWFPVKFLGFNLVVIGKSPKGYVALPTQEPQDLVKSLIFPRMISKLQYNDLTLSRFIQIVFNGVYLFPALYNAVLFKFDQLLKTVGFEEPDSEGKQREVTYQPKEDGFLSIEGFGDVALEFWEKNKRFPTRQECYEVMIGPYKPELFPPLNFEQVRQPAETTETSTIPETTFKNQFAKLPDLIAEFHPPVISVEDVGTAVRNPAKKVYKPKKPKIAEPSKAFKTKGSKFEVTPEDLEGPKGKSWADMMDEEEEFSRAEALQEMMERDLKEEREDQEREKSHFKDDEETPLRRGKQEEEEEREEDFDFGLPSSHLHHAIENESFQLYDTESDPENDFSE